MGDLSPHEQAGQEPAAVDSLEVHYARWGWAELEPEPGKIDYAFLDKVLKETHDSAEQLAFRVMCCSPSKGRSYHPKWLKAVGGRELEG